MHMTFERSLSSAEAVAVSYNLAKDLNSYLNKTGKKKIAVIASHSLIDHIDFLKDILLENLCAQSNFKFYSSSTKNNQRQFILDVAKELDADGVDCLIAVGGGSVIDVVKIISFCIHKQAFSKSEMQRYAKFSNGTAGDLSGKKDKSLKLTEPDLNTNESVKASPGLSIISIPTTLSGASYSESASVQDNMSGRKEGYRDCSLYPSVIFYHSGLASETPKWLWFSSAIRSIDHAIESLCSKKSNSYLDERFLHSLTLFSECLPSLSINYSDNSARVLAQQAENFACSGLGRVPHGASHGIGYVLTEMFNVPHGYASCVLLPAVLHWNRQDCAEQQRLISKAFGRPGDSAGAIVRELIKRLGLPNSLHEVIDDDINDELLQKVAERAIQHPVTRRNPRKITELNDVIAILKLAL
ncbi:MAG: iron-containing alcohol dehydrogenase [Cellvibrionaceae bacterium]